MSLAGSSPDSAINDWVEVQETPSRTNDEVLHVDPSLFYERINQICTRRLQDNKSPIFIVDLGADSVQSCFVQNLSAEYQPEYQCATCQRFLARYGSLGLVADDGHLIPLLWDPEDNSIDKIFHKSVRALAAKFDGCKVLKEFKVTPAKKVVGSEQRGGYDHFYLNFPENSLQKEQLKGLESAPTSQLARMLEKILSDYQIGTVRRTAQILENDKLPYADSHKAGIRWLLDIYDNDRIIGKSGIDSAARHNLIYRYAASAFTGCLNQLRSGALSTLLADVGAKRSWSSTKSQWCKLANPTQYLRPQAAPKAGNIDAAERLFKQLGLSKNDMRRRYLTLAEIPEETIIWQRRQRQKLDSAKSDKIFASVEPRPKPSNVNSELDDLPDLPATNVTFTKLINDILPKARKVEYKLAHNNALVFLITGLEITTPLMQWHMKSPTNLVSSFCFVRPFPVAEHSLKPNAWNTIHCIIPLPHLWDGVPATSSFPIDDPNAPNFKYYHKKHGFTYVLCLEGGKDREKGCELCLFPTFLKEDFHGVRATIEQYSKQGLIEWPEDADAKGGYVTGITVGRSDTEMSHLVRVTDQRGETEVYKVVLF